MNEPVTIDEEFRSLIPPLSEDEFRQLEENCKKDGILDSLKTWKGILIDGHNRYRIAEDNDLNYQAEEMEFPDRTAVLRWIILNQFGRRNLSNYDRGVLALKLKSMLREEAKKTQGTRTDILQKSVESHNTQEELAKIAGVSHDTIHKVETIEAKASEPVKQQVRSGEKSINQAYLEIKDKERKQADLSARAHLREAEERHEDFQTAKTVSVDSIKQDKKDVAEIANAKAREVYNAIKGILFIGATADYSMLKNMDDSKAKQLAGQIDSAIETLRRIRKEIK
ncbi:MAG: hypothetical protein J6I53_10990 [Treponema sp.]|nr:hypothetical protein [Treponema sp.]